MFRKERFMVRKSGREGCSGTGVDIHGCGCVGNSIQ